jgi:hypothetical protein
VSGGAPDSVRCARIVCVNRPLSGLEAAYSYNSPDCPVVHRTVQLVVRGKLVALGKRINGVRLKFTGLSCGAPDCPVNQRSSAPTVGHAIFARRVAAPTVGEWHRTVRCANWPEGATVVYARKGRRSVPDRL